MLVDDDSDLQAVADQVLLAGRQRLDDLTQALQRRSAAHLGDHCADRAGDDVRFADRSAALRHDRDTTHAAQAHADDAGGEHLAIAEQPGVARSQPTAHHAAHQGRSRHVGVEVLDEQARRECVRVRKQQMQIVCGPVELIAGEQAARAGADEVQLERFGGQAGRQPHRHPGLVLQFAAAGDDRLGDATDQRGRLDCLLDRLEDVPSLVGVRSRCEQHGQRRHLARELVARVLCGPHGSLPRLARGRDPDSDPHTSMMRRLGRVSQFSGAHAGVNDCTGQQDAAEVGQGVFVVAGRDAAPLLEPVEAALDGVA